MVLVELSSQGAACQDSSIDQCLPCAAALTPIERARIGVRPKFASTIDFSGNCVPESDTTASPLVSKTTLRIENCAQR